MNKIKMFLGMFLFLMLGTVGVLAHETSDQADDTPLASPQALENALDNLVDAIGNSDGAAANSLLRNPTCHDHHTEAGIHPPGNP